MLDLKLLAERVCFLLLFWSGKLGFLRDIDLLHLLRKVLDPFDAHMLPDLFHLVVLLLKHLLLLLPRLLIVKVFIKLVLAHIDDIKTVIDPIH